MSKSVLYVSVALLVFWSIVVGAGDFFVVSAAVRQYQSEDFVPTTGMIRVSKITQRLLINAGITIEYTYPAKGALNGKTFRGSGYRYDDQQSSLDGMAILLRYPKWTVQTVYYNPKNPADAILSTGLNGSDLLMLLFAVPLNVALVMLWLWPVARLQEKRATTQAGGLKIRSNQGRIRVKVEGISPFAASFYALAAAAFLAAFPLVALGGFDPDLRASEFVWLAVLAAGVAAFAWSAKKSASGHYDLWIDENARTVSLPQNSGRRQRITFPLDDLAGVALQRRLVRLSSGNFYSYLPALIRLDAARNPQKERLIAWGWSEEKARGFTQWLCNRFGCEFKGVEDENPEAVG